MKAIIMAGGEGQRLRPLTCDCPKPMVPILDRPVMAYALMLLRKHQITDAGVTLAYLPDQIERHFGSGSDMGMRLRYYVEQEPLGTAGSVKQAQSFLNETFIVLSGDGLTDCDLTAAVAFHKQKRAMATIVLKKMDVPIEYGVVVTDREGRVQRFIEKPDWGEVNSDQVNTGIYIFEPQILTLIPEGRRYDFGRELLPLLVSMGEPVYGYPMNGYWCDVGDVAAYMRAHMDVLDGKLSLFDSKRAVIKQKGAMIDGSAVIEEPCYIGEGAVIAAGASIGAYSVIGAGSHVKPHAGLKRAILWRGASVGEHAQLRGCVVQCGAKVGSGASMFEESILATDAQLGADAILMPNVKVWPQKRIEPGERLMRNLIWGSHLVPGFEGGELAVSVPMDAISGAQALCGALMPDTVMLARDASAQALALSRAACCALMAQGAQVVEVGAMALPQLRFAMDSLGADAALWVGKEKMLPLGAQGLPLMPAARRKLQSALQRGESESPFARGARPPIAAPNLELAYLHALTKDIAPIGIPVALYCEQPQLLGLMERAFRRAGVSVRAEWEKEMMALDDGEVGIYLSADGEGVILADADGELSSAQSELLPYWLALKAGSRKLIVPRGATGGVQDLARDAGVEMSVTGSDRAEYLAQLRAVDHHQFRCMTDGLLLALSVLSSMATEHIGIPELREQLPNRHRCVKKLTVALREKGAILRGLSDRFPDADQSDGIFIEDERGWAWISPMGDLRECMIIAESMHSETASELSDFYGTHLESAIKALRNGK